MNERPLRGADVRVFRVRKAPLVICFSFTTSVCLINTSALIYQDESGTNDRDGHGGSGYSSRADNYRLRDDRGRRGAPTRDTRDYREALSTSEYRDYDSRAGYSSRDRDNNYSRDYRRDGDLRASSYDLRDSIRDRDHGYGDRDYRRGAYGYVETTTGYSSSIGIAVAIRCS